MSEVVGILQERMHAEEVRMWERAEVMERTTHGRLRDQSEEYRTVLDNHLRQVAASKDQQMEHMKREYPTEVAKKDIKISDLEGLIRMQSEQIASQQKMAEDLNMRMNQLLGSAPPPPLETGTMTIPCITKVQTTLNAEAKAFQNSKWEAKRNLGPLMRTAYGCPSRAAATPTVFPNLIPPVSPDISTGWSQATGMITPQEQLPPSPTEPANTPVEAAIGGAGG